MVVTGSLSFLVYYDEILQHLSNCSAEITTDEWVNKFNYTLYIYIIYYTYLMHYITHTRTVFLWRIRIYYYNTRYSVNGSEKLDSSGLNLNWIKMLTRTREYIPGARVLLDLGNVSVNRRIFINIYNIICTQTYIAARVGTCRINYVFFLLFLVMTFPS